MLTELWMTQLLSLKAVSLKRKEQNMPFDIDLLRSQVLYQAAQGAVSLPNLQPGTHCHHDYSIPAHSCCEAGACKACVMCNSEGVNHNHSRQEMFLEPGSAAQSSQQCCEKDAECCYNI